MGNDENSSRIIQKISFQPRDAFHIQVVGRLIQKKDIRLGEKHLSKCHTGFLASGKFLDLFVVIFFRETKTLQDTGELTFVSIAVFQFKLMGEAGICLHQAVQVIAFYGIHFLLHITDTAFHIDNMLFGGKKLFVDGMVSVDILVLGKIADIFVPGKYYRAGIRGNLLHDDTKKSSLSSTVTSDKSCLFPVFNMKRCII